MAILDAAAATLVRQFSRIYAITHSHNAHSANDVVTIIFIIVNIIVESISADNGWYATRGQPTDRPTESDRAACFCHSQLNNDFLESYTMTLGISRVFDSSIKTSL